MHEKAVRFFSFLQMSQGYAYKEERGMLRSEEGGGGIFEKLYPGGKQALRRRCHDMKRDFETPEVRAILFWRRCQCFILH